MWIVLQPACFVLWKQSPPKHNIHSEICHFWQDDLRATDPIPPLPVHSRDDHALLWDSSVIVAGMPDHTIAVLVNTYAHFIPTMQDQAAQPARKNSSLGFAAKCASQLMDEILTPIPIELLSKS